MYLKRHLNFIGGLPTGLSGCDKRAEAPEAEGLKTTATADAMSSMEKSFDS